MEVAACHEEAAEEAAEVAVVWRALMRVVSAVPVAEVAVTAARWNRSMRGQ